MVDRVDPRTLQKNRAVHSEGIESKMKLNLCLINHQAMGARGGAVVEALRYKPEGRGIDSRWNFSLT
jgi:hypothetical protein